MRILEKVKKFLSRRDHRGVDKYSSQNEHDHDTEIEYGRVRVLNALRTKPASIRGVRPYANRVESDVSAI